MNTGSLGDNAVRARVDALVAEMTTGKRLVRSRKRLRLRCTRRRVAECGKSAERVSSVPRPS
jgi:hypothetical protein